MKLRGAALLFGFLCTIYICWAQENAGSSVANSLIECYNTTEHSKDRLLPATVNVLLDLIRRVEDGPTSVDARQLAIQLIHRFRQDGIIRSVSTSSLSVPYSPRGFQRHKNGILLRRLVPGNAQTFPNDTLTPLQRCSLHNMLSNSIEITQRGDEGTTCSRLARYTVRVRRDTEDVEIFNPKLGPPIAQLQDDGEDVETKVEDDIPANNEDVPIEEGSEQVPEISRATTTITKSDCPIENGVVYTQWGAIQAGTVIAGIASGLERQEITVANEAGTYVVDSRYAVTLAGDLSEAALQQGTRSATIVTGNSGGWNSTTVPRYYFLSSNTNFEATDAEIRAGLDGLILASNVLSWRSSFSTLKVSQILDMYYSPRGVFNNTIRACNRKNLQTTYAPSETLYTQTTGFNNMLDDVVPLEASLLSAELVALGQRAVDSLISYLPNNLDDLICSSTGDTVDRAATDIIIALDASWSYTTIQPALSYLLDYIDINKFGSNFTLINGQDGSLVVNSSRSIVDFHEQFNLTVHQRYASGFSYINVFNTVQDLVGQRTNNDSTLNGKSTLLLLVPATTSISDEERQFLNNKKEYFKTYVPDLRMLVLGSGTKDNYADAVFDSAYDIFTLSTTTTDSVIISAVKPLVSRIKQFPRRIVNPNCRSDWSGSTLSTGAIDQYVEPTSINYYRVAPNYFYSNTGDRVIRIRGQGYGSLNVCYSRSVTLPSSNATSDVTCSTINTDEVTYNFNSHCDGHSLISSCPSFYFSVAPVSSESTTYRCTDTLCRFPDNLKYTITIENFGCVAGSSTAIASLALLIVSFAVAFVRL